MNEPAAQPRPKKLRIVLVDDEPHMLQLFELYLRDWFQEVELVPFQNGDDAWRELARTEPDLLITDWRHPGLDGGELVRKLAEKNASFPVLMISACDTDSVRAFTCLGVKIVFLQKPFGHEQLWQVLNELVGPCDVSAHRPKFQRSHS
jgi:two-component system OmpR family response regulator